jgi:processive 1,2-diacylglycerol beta-glucosyltransferase
MADKKRILILYASAGHGHSKAAMAVEQAIRAQGLAEVKAVDALSVCPPYFKRGYEGLYYFLIRRLAWLWGFLYFLTDNPFVYIFVKIARRLHNAFFAKMLESYILTVDPDVLICTHFLGSEVAEHLKRKGLLRSKLITVITDYLPHTFWLEKHTDLYAVGSDETKADLIRRGIPENKIRITGIPIEEKFSHKLSRAEAASKLGIDPEQFTVLITSGGGGVGLVEPLVDQLLYQNQALQILAVCGTNQALAQRLQKKASPSKLLVFGFVDNIQELMAASDLLVGKGGGLTITESLCMGLPMVLVGALPGQETRNVSCMLSNGSARRARSATQAVSQIKEFISHEELLREYRLSAEKNGKPRAAFHISDLAQEVCH